MVLLCALLTLHVHTSWLPVWVSCLITTSAAMERDKMTETLAEWRIPQLLSQSSQPQTLASLSSESQKLRVQLGELACVFPHLGILTCVYHLSVNYKYTCPFFLERLPLADFSCHEPSHPRGVKNLCNQSSIGFLVSQF